MKKNRHVELDAYQAEMNGMEFKFDCMRRNGLVAKDKNDDNKSVLTLFI